MNKSITNAPELDLPPEVRELLDHSVEGNITPLEWYGTIKLQNNKPDVIAITLLADLVYWYRPTTLRDEVTGNIIGYKKKFKQDILQRGYKDLEDLFGFSKKQIREALCRLEKLKAIRREFRNIQISGGLLTNVMFIRIFPRVIKDLSILQNGFSPRSKLSQAKYNSKKVNTLFPAGNKVLTQKAPLYHEKDMMLLRDNHDDTPQKYSPHSQNDNTYTENTTNITTYSPDSDSANAYSSFFNPLSPEKLLETWNKTICSDSDKKILFTPKRLHNIQRIVSKYFNNNAEEWQNFVNYIKTTDFLMGGVTHFKITIDWILNEENLVKVLEGAYENRQTKQHNTDAKERGDFSNRQSNKTIVTNHISRMQNPEWKEVNKMLFKEDEDAYLSWLIKLSFIEFEDGVLCLGTDNSFVKETIESKFLKKLQMFWRKTNGVLPKIRIMLLRQTTKHSWIDHI